MSRLDSVAYRARWVLPIDGPPLEDGLVSVCDQRIVEVGNHSQAQKIIDLGDVTLVPSFINAHTHLEFSDLVLPLGQPRQLFPDWIQDVVAFRRNQPAEESDRRRQVAVEQGLVESMAAGTYLIGEIAPPGWPREPFAESQLGGVVFLELLGLGAERIEPLFQLACEHVQKSLTGASWKPGLSPHAPYTVHPELLTRVCELSARERVPVAMHLAESYEEIELLAAHSGPFVAALENLQAWRSESLPRGIQPLDYLHTLATANRALVIHGNFLVGEEIDYLAQQENMAVVYCPRTHDYFHGNEHPVQRMLAAGVRVAVGTDSRASNPDLSIWEELRFVRKRYSGLSDLEILRMGTLTAAAALGCDDQYGSLTPGKMAAMNVLRGRSLWESSCSPLETFRG